MQKLTDSHVPFDPRANRHWGTKHKKQVYNFLYFLFWSISKYRRPPFTALISSGKGREKRPQNAVIKDDVLSESSANITKAHLWGYEYALWPDERQTLHTSAIKSAIMAISPNYSYKAIILFNTSHWILNYLLKVHSSCIVWNLCASSSKSRLIPPSIHKIFYAGVSVLLPCVLACEPKPCKDKYYTWFLKAFCLCTKPSLIY